MSDPNMFRRQGTAIKAITLAPQVPSQEVSNRPAIDPGPPLYYDANPPLEWNRALPVFAFFTILCGGLFVPRPWQVAIGVGVVVVGIVKLATATREAQ